MRHSRVRAFQSESTQPLSAKLWLSLILLAVVSAAIAAVSIPSSAYSKGEDGSRIGTESQSKLLGRGTGDRSAQRRAENRTTSAFVSPMMATITVDTAADVPVLSACTASPGDCTLRGAVQFANANPGTTISVPAGTYTLTIPGGVPEGFNGNNLIGDLDFRADNTIVIGAGASTTIIQQTAPNDRVIELNPDLLADFDFSISGVTISGGNETTFVGGGGIISGAINNTTTVTNCTFSGNSANGPGGGGISNQGGSLTVTGSTFTGNSASSSGGAIGYSAGDPFGRVPSTGALTISGSTFSNNTANSTAGGGGGLDLYNFNSGISSYSVSSSSFSGNAASNGSGGAILVESGPLTLTTSSLANNSAGAAGGAIASNGSASITYSRLFGNTVPTATNGLTLFRGAGTMTAADNWWGRNAGPAPNDFRASGGVSITPATWLQLQHSASPTTICVGGTSTLSANILKRNTGADLTTELNGLPRFAATFTNTTPGVGTVTGATDFVNGQASATFTATNSGTAEIDVTADNETVRATVVMDSNSTTDPADQALCEGATATFTTTASGPGTITFVWKKGATVLNDGDLGGRVSGATTNSLSISSLQSSDADTYTVEATGSCNTASQSATLMVNAATTATDPADQTVCEGAVASFSTTAMGDNLQFAWTVDGSPAGGNSSTLNVDTTGFSAGVHPVTLTVTGACGTVEHSATLTVNANTTATDPADATVCQGAMANFSTTASGTNISYQWTLDGNNTGTNSPNLAVDTSSLSAGSHTVGLTVTGECGQITHSATLNVDSPAVTTDPADQSVCQGQTAMFTTTASGTGPFSFVWKKGAMVLVNGDFGGRVSIVNTATTSTLTISNVQGTDAGAYSVETTGGGVCANTAIQTANLAVDAAPPTIVLNGQNITLWPPNHKYQTVNLTDLVASAGDSCDPSVDINDVTIAAVTSDEVEDSATGGDGTTLNDIVIAADCKSVQLRAERDSDLDGRVYTITFVVTDTQGNTGTATAKVTVPRTQSGAGAVDSGAKYSKICP